MKPRWTRPWKAATRRSMRPPRSGSPVRPGTWSLVPTDDRPLLDALDLKLRPVEETLADAIRWLALAGHLDPAKAGKLIS